MTTTVPEQDAAAQAADPRHEYIRGLRALADALENHPELPLPYQGSHPNYGRLSFHFLSSENPRAEMAAARRALGVPLEKDARDGDTYLDLKGNLHGLYFLLTAFRKDVCERVVTGTREVEIEEPDPAAVASLPKVKTTVTIEDVEWVCHPILAGAAAEQVEAVTHG
ncbi:hypothetical protein JOL79_11675 [Microbispora sp. RL4-1S]|uniref:Uncharacterized protein n=1 Tax=Microbispora oryzae TaxID=2806554 RepID=A0A941AQ93_9ACTN|nr:hypothetical protein [Microbispora oryzae]MBP2704474.1 hypothetical protein [Microbispora oryzae]